MRRQLRRDYREEDLTSEGLRIYTTLDPWLQDVAEKALDSRLAQIEKERKMAPGTLEGAVVVASPQGGEVLAVVGTREAGSHGFNRALDAVRPIGSLVKPAVYLTALSDPGRFNLLTPLEDEPVSVKLAGGVWSPENYDKRSRTAPSPSRRRSPSPTTSRRCASGWRWACRASRQHSRRSAWSAPSTSSRRSCSAPRP